MVSYAMVLNSSMRKQLNSLIYFTGEKIYPDFNQEANERYMRVCEKRALELLSSSMKFVGLINLGTSLFVVFPMIAFVFSNEIQLPVPMLFPFTDLESLNGLVINMLNQLWFGFVGLAGNVFIEVSACLLKNSIWMTAAAICHSIDEISEKIKKTVSNTEMYCIEYSFRNILIQVQDLDR